MGLFSNPSKKAISSLNNIDQNAQNAMQPYNQFSNLGPQISQQYQQMYSNPMQYMNDMRSQYEKTPQHELALQDSMKMANNAAVAGGMVGTPMHQRDLMSTASGINNQYEQQFIDKAMNAQKYGLQGAQGLYDMSRDTDLYLNKLFSNTEANRGQINMNSAQANNQRNQEVLNYLGSQDYSNLFQGGQGGQGGSSNNGLLKALISSAMGAAGTYFGGPAGGAAATGLGNSAYDYFYQ